MYLAYAPSTFWWLAAAGLAVLALTVRGAGSWSALATGAAFSIAFYVPLLIWTTEFVGPIANALAVAQTLLTAPITTVVARVQRTLNPWARAGWPVSAAAAWTAGEALRARVPFGGFPWGSVAFSQVEGPLLPAAAAVGAVGLSLLTALAGFALAAILHTLWRAVPARSHRAAVRWRHAGGALIVGGVCIATSFGVARIGLAAIEDGATAPTKIIAVIQGNVPQPGLEFNARRRAVTELHAAQTAALAADVRSGQSPQPDLVVWPENSSDIDPFRDEIAAAMITAAARDIGVPILIGAVVAADDLPAPQGSTYNMGILWDPVTGAGQTYTKRHPVPFAEYMPYRTFFRSITSWADRAGRFIPGQEPGVIEAADVTIGDVICFEIAYADLVRDVIDGGAEALVVQTNNATFGWTDGTYQQQAMSRVRAVEFGRTVLIAATSGVSAVIRTDGSVESSLPLFTPGYMTPVVPLMNHRTPGAQLGPIVELVAVAITLAALATAAAGPVARWRTSRRPRALEQPR